MLGVWEGSHHLLIHEHPGLIHGGIKVVQEREGVIYRATPKQIPWDGIEEICGDLTVCRRGTVTSAKQPSHCTLMAGAEPCNI